MKGAELADALKRIPFGNVTTNATNKPFNIDKKVAYEAYKAVKSNGGAAGVDGQTIEHAVVCW